MTTSSPRTIGIAGAGVLGRLLAWHLAKAGCQVDVFDAATGPEPIFRSQAPEPPAPYIPTAAAFTAAGMLSPIAELDTVEPAVAALGWRSIELWRDICATLPGAPMLFRALGSLMLAHRSDLGAAQRVLDRLAAACATPEWQAASPQEGVRPMTLDELHTLEPSLHGPAHAWMLPGEGQIDTFRTMRGLMQATLAAPHPARWHWGRPVRCVEPDGTLHFEDGSVEQFDGVIDVRGVGAKVSKGADGATPSPIFDVRGVRGEVFWLHAPAHGLTHLSRLLHPRHSVYLVPCSPNLLLVGASELESEDRSPASLRTTLELLAAAHSAMPALAEARIMLMDVNLRPALPDNNPLTEWSGKCLRINGLFRHGWLLAPALVERALPQTGWLAA